MAVLSKGLNFAPAPRIIPYADIIGGIKQAVRRLPEVTAVEIRSEVPMVLKRAIPPKSNISRKEREAIRTLRNNPDLTILPADKGNATVILKTDEYRQKILDILNDASCKTQCRDATDAITRKTVDLMKKCGLPQDTVKNLRPQAPVPPRI
ncbi:uncharacterized protein LOC124159616 [Ischnura elegans]|uniref:uncharacterized protein LOC124159616 n=1 Tax=Ischnura elegans TaxID=197161 RepID=UPI001ED8AE1A|nr:uncharacterized protein LOC124159616 [Ischnura elegans]